ncbi:MAG: class I SAM-dependent methyltransferase [Acuticoccus sp.]
MTAATCPVCAGARLEPVIELPGQPVVCNALYDDADAARAAPVADVALAVCADCGLVFNAAFDAARIRYETRYENALHHSPSFRAYAERLADDLVARYNLAGRNVTEIGCGDGYFLRLLLDRGVVHATGYDPSMAGRHDESDARLTIVPDLFAAETALAPFDALVCRHVLEHLPDPQAFAGTLRQASRDAVLYIEVPNGAWLLDTVSVWDVIYEHVTYWTEPAMRTLLRRAGFRPIRIEPAFGGQFLSVEAVPDEADEAYLPAGAAPVREAAQRFAAAARASIDDWSGRLAGQGVAAIWGAGSKGITFANAIKADAIAAMVDLNPRKHGLCAPVSAIPVVAPDALAGFAPSLVLIANGLYQGEIVRTMREMGVDADVAVIAGPG